MTATYGYEVQPEGDPFIGRTREAVDITKRVLTPERTLLMAFQAIANAPLAKTKIGSFRRDGLSYSVRWICTSSFYIYVSYTYNTLYVRQSR